MALSKILIIGATGYIGKHLVNASVRLGHPTFLLVRSTNPSDSSKAELLKSFTDAGVILLLGNITDHASLVAALKQVDVVISAVNTATISAQINIIEAAKEAGTIKRFLPSEFGHDSDRVKLDSPGSKWLLEPKQEVRRAAEKSGIPYTFVVSNAFAGAYLTLLSQDETRRTPPRDGKLVILGDGNVKAVVNDERDIGTFTIKAVEDPRAANKTLFIRRQENLASANEVIALWEKKIGHTFEKEFLDKERVAKAVAELRVPQNIVLYIKYLVFIKGQANFELDNSKEVEAAALYPDVKYSSIDECLDNFV